MQNIDHYPEIKHIIDHHVNQIRIQDVEELNDGWYEWVATIEYRRALRYLDKILGEDTVVRAYAEQLITEKLL